jgi:hypothetical protein
MSEHTIYKRKGTALYAEVYSNIPGKRGGKKFVRYIGRVFGPFRFGPRATDLDARMAQMLDTAERKADEIAAEQREKYGETAEERRARLEDQVRFSPQAFLEETNSAEIALEPAEQSPQTEDTDNSSSSETWSEPGAEASSES